MQSDYDGFRASVKQLPETVLSFSAMLFVHNCRPGLVQLRKPRANLLQSSSVCNSV
jgi:hypothetical protein